MLSQLAEVGAPPADDDSDAAEAVEGLEHSLRATRDNVTEWVGLLAPARPEEVTGGLELVAKQLSGAMAQLQTTLETLGTPGGELEDEFAHADSCQELMRDREQNRKRDLARQVRRHR